MRQRKELKENILEAAKDIAMQEGWSAVTIRKIAEKIEYTPPIVYQYFEDKEELLREIRREGYQKLLINYQHALNSSKTPVGILTNLAQAYWDFAWENPELYKIMYGVEGLSTGTQGLENEIAAIRCIIKDTLSVVLHTSEKNSQLQSFDWENAVDTMRCLLHGAITFSMIGGLSGSRERAHKLAMQGVQDLVKFWMKN